MTARNEKDPYNPKELLERATGWKELIGFFALTIASIVGGLFGPERGYIKTISWIVATVLVVGGIFVWQRIRKRRSRSQVWSKEAPQQDRKIRAAFRSLAAFEERDDLPGLHRQVEARSIATRVASDDFRFGVLCGHVGCGKTSLLRTEVSRVLRQFGLDVAYVRSYHRVEGASERNVARLNAELETITANYLKPNTRVLILDQFEEWLNAYPELEYRQQIGSFIRGIVERPLAVRVLVSIRPEYLIDVHDLTTAMAEPLSSKNLFHIRYFGIEQAVDIIRQCASSDGLTCDETFAETVASDLAEGGEVRPTELQIVCTYLAATGKLNTSEYHRSGGTSAILAHYIKDALASSKLSEIGSRMLRTLSDFPARAKRKPATIDELMTALEDTTSLNGPRLRAAIQEVIQHFMSNRILAEEVQGNGVIGYGLIHDYLVDAVQIATSDASTKTEEANQLLKYYVSEKDVTIPMRKLRFIKKFAERRYLEEPAARRALRRSTLAPVMRAGLPIIVAVLIAGIFYLFATTEKQWRLEVLGRHWSDANAAGSTSMVRVLGDKLLAAGGTQLRLWDPTTGKLLRTIDSLGLTSLGVNDYDAKFVFLQSGNPELDPRARLVNLETGEATEITLPKNIHSVGITDRETKLAWASGDKTPRAKYTITIYSVEHRKPEIEVQNLFLPSDRVFPVKLFDLNNAGDRLLAITARGNRDVVELIDATSGKTLETLLDSSSGTIQSWELNDFTSQACTASLLNSDVLLIRLWDLHSARLINETRLSLKELGIDSRVGVYVSFNKNGSKLILHRIATEAEPPILVLSSSNFGITKDVPRYEKQLVQTGDDREMFFWSDGETTRFLDVDNNDAPVTIPPLAKDAAVTINTNGTRALVSFPNGEITLYALPKWEQIAKLEHSGPVLYVAFTIDDSAVRLIEEGDYVSVFDALNGERIIQHASMGLVRELYYDRECRSVHVWNASGQVVRYREGRSFFGRFMPSKRCY